MNNSSEGNPHNATCILVKIQTAIPFKKLNLQNDNFYFSVLFNKVVQLVLQVQQGRAVQSHKKPDGIPQLDLEKSQGDNDLKQVQLAKKIQ